MTTIMIHGLGQTKDSWSTVIKDLAREDVICVDLSSLTSRKPIVYQDLYDGLTEICHAYQSPIELVGLSLGGVLALNYAIDFPDRVKTLVLINAQYKMPKLLLTLQNLFFRYLPDEKFAGLGFSKTDFLSISQSMKRLDFSKRLNNIRSRTLVVHGEKDRFNQKAAIELSRLIPHANLVTIAGAGHIVNSEKPYELAKEMSCFDRH